MSITALNLLRKVVETKNWKKYTNSELEHLLFLCSTTSKDPDKLKIMESANELVNIIKKHN